MKTKQTAYIIALSIILLLFCLTAPLLTIFLIARIEPFGPFVALTTCLFLVQLFVQLLIILTRFSHITQRRQLAIALSIMSILPILCLVLLMSLSAVISLLASATPMAEAIAGWTILAVLLIGFALQIAGSAWAWVLLSTSTETTAVPIAPQVLHNVVPTFRTPTAHTQTVTTRSKKHTIGLWILLAPVIIFIGGVILAAILGGVLSSTPLAEAIAKLTGGLLAIITIPCIITGTILLVKRK